MLYGFYFLLALLLTVVLETLTLFFVARYLLKIKTKTRDIVYWGVFVNLFSLPYLWFVFPLFIPSYDISILIGEILVVIIELVILFKALKISLKEAFSLSLIANFVSYVIGIILF
ncbi:MAG: hypothetical protein ABH884_00040 [Candidatus Komeilibacteria bacterium]